MLSTYYIKHTTVDKDEAKTNFKCCPKMYWEMTHHDNKIKIMCKEPNNQPTCYFLNKNNNVFILK